MSASGAGARRLRTVLLATALAVAAGCAAEGAPEAAAVAADDVLRIDGEIYARETVALMPPSIDDVWQFNITQLAPDGAPVKRGEPVLGFDGGELTKRLMEKQSVLKEKTTQLEKLELELAERERTEALATAEAVALHEKAVRKTQLPEAIVPGIEYRKLVIERQRAERRLALLRQRERLAAEQRRQERRLITSEVAQLQAEVADTRRALASLTLLAPRDGLMMHKSSWSGEKFDVGSQVWRGQGVAEIPDTRSLAVRAELPERELLGVAAGMPVRVVIEGGAGGALRGTVTQVGRAVRSKSRAQPIPIVDLEIALSDRDAKLRPGQPVSVEIAKQAGGRS